MVVRVRNKHTDLVVDCVEWFLVVMVLYYMRSFCSAYACHDSLELILYVLNTVLMEMAMPKGRFTICRELWISNANFWILV